MKIRPFHMIAVLLFSLPLGASATVAIDPLNPGFVSLGFQSSFGGPEFRSTGDIFNLPAGGTLSKDMFGYSVSGNYAMSQSGVSFDYSGSAPVAESYASINNDMIVGFSVDEDTNYSFSGAVEASIFVLSDLRHYVSLFDLTIGSELLRITMEETNLGDLSYNLLDYVSIGSATGTLTAGHVYNYYVDTTNEFESSGVKRLTGQTALAFEPVPGPASIFIILAGLLLLPITPRHQLPRQ